MNAHFDTRRQLLLDLISKHAGRPATEASTLASIDLDSLDTVDLIIAIEDHFENAITIDDDAWTEDTTVKVVIDDVLKLLADVN